MVGNENQCKGQMDGDLGSGRKQACSLGYKGYKEKLDKDRDRKWCRVWYEILGG